MTGSSSRHPVLRDACARLTSKQCSHASNHLPVDCASGPAPAPSRPEASPLRRQHGRRAHACSWAGAPCRVGMEHVARAEPFTLLGLRRPPMVSGRQGGWCSPLPGRTRQQEQKENTHHAGVKPFACGVPREKEGAPSVGGITEQSRRTNRRCGHRLTSPQHEGEGLPGSPPPASQVSS